MGHKMRGNSAVVADIGGTNARFAVADLDTLELSSTRHFSCAEHPSIAHAVSAYLSGLDELPRRAAFAVAAPVVSEKISFTNSSWSFTRSELCNATGLADAIILNDFEALALSLPHLSAAELHKISGGDVVPRATKLVTGPGTGIGVAGLVWAGERWVAVSGEGGHISLAAGTTKEFELAERLRAGRPHLSVERVLSGPGLAELYRVIAASHGKAEQKLTPSEVLSRGAEGSDATAVAALEHFTIWLGGFAGDAALLFGALGGVYLGGGIAPKMIDALSSEAFAHAFANKGRMRNYVALIPVYVIIDEYATLKGAAAHLRSCVISRPQF